MARKIWIDGNVKTWCDVLGTNDETPIHIYTRTDEFGAAETFANWFGAKQEELGGTAVFGDPGLAAAIQKDIFGIGFNNIGYAYNNDTHKLNTDLEIFPIDNDNSGDISDQERFYDVKENVTKAIAEGRYPSPPARDLYLVTKGVPTDPIVVAFLKYVLTDGQKKNDPVGYIEISKDKIDKALERLQDSQRNYVFYHHNFVGVCCGNGRWTVFKVSTDISSTFALGISILVVMATVQKRFRFFTLCNGYNLGNFYCNLDSIATLAYDCNFLNRICKKASKKVCVPCP